MSSPPDQSRRLAAYLSGEPPPPIEMRVRFDAVDADLVLTRTRQVMTAIASAQRTGWPSEDHWRRTLPPWFVRAFVHHAVDVELRESVADLWDFGSWLEALKDPGWEWWSAKIEDRACTVFLSARSRPCAVEPLLLLVRVAGAREVVVESQA